jgi:hypothetical protein
MLNKRKVMSKKKIDHMKDGLIHCPFLQEIKHINPLLQKNRLTYNGK